MSQALTRLETAPLAPLVTNEQLDLVRRTVANGATDAELQLYLYDCQRHGVHPLDKLLHFTKRKGRYTPITSIDLLRSRASDTGEHGGTDDPRYTGEAGKSDFTATVTVYRIVQGQRCPFSATARWSEYKPDEDFMWRKMPHLMLGKCAEALALRKAFPRQLAGLYAQEEMDQSDTRLQDTPARLDVATGEVYDQRSNGPLATQKQRNYIAALQDEMGWHSEALIAFAAQHGVDDLVMLSSSQASALIEAMKQEAERPAPSAKTSARAALEARLEQTIKEARALGIDVRDADQIGGEPDADLIAAGKKLRAEIEKAKQAADKARDELFDDPELDDAVDKAIAGVGK